MDVLYVTVTVLKNCLEYSFHSTWSQKLTALVICCLNFALQPFPLQASSLFGGSVANPSTPGAFGPVGVGNIPPRHVNIHIHTGMKWSGGFPVSSS